MDPLFTCVRRWGWLAATTALLAGCQGAPPTSQDPSDVSPEIGGSLESAGDADIDAGPDADLLADDADTGGGDATGPADGEAGAGDVLEPGVGPVGAPIEAEADTWTWVPVPESVCGDGSSTGLAVNLHPGADTAVLYLEGGGACWDYATCFGLATTSFHLDGYDEESFFSLFNTVYMASLFFDRDSPKSPTPDAHYVFLPYCTGDVHSGDAVVELEGLFPWQKETMHFKGRHNMEHYLERIAPTLAEVDRILVVGASAGGFGALFNWPMVQEAFPGKRVDVIDDSGPPVAMGQDRWTQWRDTWAIQFPEACGSCLESIPTALDWVRQNVLPGNTLALVSHQRDTIIATFMGMLPGQFQGLLEDIIAVFDQEDGAHYFVLPGHSHTPTVLSFEMGIEVNDLPLWRWLQQMVDDDEEWTSHQP